MNKRIIFMLLLLTAVAFVGIPQALASSSFLDTFRTTYPDAVGTRIDTCFICHIAVPSPRNQYGTDFATNGFNFTAIESLDSDMDGFTNIEEIQSLTFPGNASDFPPTNRTFAADLTGSEEVPPVATLARGNATFNLSDDGNVLQFKVTVANITNVTLSHIHLAPAGVNGSIVANLFTGPTKIGRFDGVLAEGSITQANLTGPLAGLPLSALLENMTSGNTYVNVHTTQNPGGEIRGQIRVAPAPDARFSISGFKINGNTGSGIQGWNITLRNGTTDELIDSMPTDANGFYQFIVLVNGSYNVSEETRPGFTPVGATFQTETISGQDVTNVNFTNNVTVPPVNPPEITGWGNNKTNDASLDITVNVSETVLFNATANQSIDTWDWSVDDVNQNNNFDNFSKHFDAAGTFTVKVNATNANGTSNTVTWNVTVQAPPQATFNISGFKIDGDTGNGIEGWNITLANDTMNITAVTDATGLYIFQNLPNGTYNVTEELKAGWMNTSPISQEVTINGSDVTNVNFTNTLIPVTPPVTFNISGFKINGATGNGIEGWNITLTNETMQTTAVTDATGVYQFTNLLNGTYTVTEELKPDWTNVSPVSQVVTINGTDMMNVNFTNQPVTPPPAAFNISGFKLNDTNGNGVWDPGEVGIENWNIKLLNDTTGTEIANTTTNADGFYIFMNLPNGTYNVTEEIKEGWANTSETSLIIILNGSDATNVNFKNQLVPPLPPPPAAFNISGFKIDGDTGNGIENWNITLANDTMNITAVTDATGLYIFQNLPNGTYNVTEELKAGWMNTGPISQEVTINGSDVTNVNFTNTLIPVTPPAAFNISGFKIDDIDGNGRRDPGEMGLGFWNITLTNETMQMTAVTDENGFYQFTNLLNGTYNVTEELIPAWRNTSPVSQVVTINGADVTNVNFTNQLIPPPLATFNISGFKINDTNGNGIWDPGEVGLENWNIILTNETTQMTATTDANGFYQFTDLLQGTYTVREELKPDWTNTSPMSREVTIADMDIINVNFTNQRVLPPPPPPARNSISGFKINDLNGNGRQDQGEEGLSNWTIRLIGIGAETSGITRKATTDDRGFYIFEDLPAGKYLILESLKGGYVPTGAVVKIVDLEEGENSENNNFTNRPVSSLIRSPGRVRDT